MTTTNGGSQGRVVEHVEGIIAAANDRGVHLQGEPDWRNWSKWAESKTQPARGQHVRLSLDGSGFVRELQVLDGPPLSTSASSSNRDREIRAQVAIKTAAQLVGAFAQMREEVKVEHVFPLADKILAWLEQKGSEQPN